MNTASRRRSPVASRNGVVFASFSQPNETFEDYLGPLMLGYFDRVFDGRALKVLGYQRQRLPSNWKLMFENIKDPYHASLLHVFLVTFGLFRLDQQSAVEMDETGRHGVLVNRRGQQKSNEATAQMRAFRQDLTLARDPAAWHRSGARISRRRHRRHADAVAQPDRAAAIERAGDAPDRAARRAEFRPGVDAFRLRRRAGGDDRSGGCGNSNLFGPAGLVSADDGEAMILSQAGIAGDDDGECLVEMGGRDIANVPHMVTETAIRGFYQHYRAVMGL